MNHKDINQYDYYPEWYDNRVSGNGNTDTSAGLAPFSAVANSATAAAPTAVAHPTAVTPTVFMSGSVELDPSRKTATQNPEEYYDKDRIEQQKYYSVPPSSQLEFLQAQSQLQQPSHQDGSQIHQPEHHSDSQLQSTHQPQSQPHQKQQSDSQQQMLLLQQANQQFNLQYYYPPSGTSSGYYMPYPYSKPSTEEYGTALKNTDDTPVNSYQAYYTQPNLPTNTSSYGYYPLYPPGAAVMQGTVTPNMIGQRNPTRHRITVACQRCRRRKIKCSGVNPELGGIDGKCRHCYKGGHECIFITRNYSQQESIHHNRTDDGSFQDTMENSNITA